MQQVIGIRMLLIIFILGPAPTLGHAGYNDDLIASNFVSFSTWPFDASLVMDSTTLNCSNPLTCGYRIAPYFNYFNDAHAEGPRKWYIYYSSTLPVAKVWLPARGGIRSSGFSNVSATDTMNSETVYRDTGVYIDVSTNVAVYFGHLTLKKSIKDAVDAAPGGYIFFDAGTHIGYVNHPLWVALDFGVSDKRFDSGISPDPAGTWHDANPLDYFSSALRAEILQKNAYYYDVWASSGHSPFLDITDSRSNINIEGTLWGLWFDEINPYFAFSGQAAVFNLFKRTLFSTSTFHQYLAENPSMDGMLHERGSQGGPPGRIYSHANAPFIRSKVFIAYGNEQAGVLRVQDDDDASRRVFIKYGLEPGAATPSDDKLRIEDFSALEEAQSATFSANSRVFRKIPNPFTVSSGTVIHAADQSPIAGATVRLHYGENLASFRSTTTDNAGRYIFESMLSVSNDRSVSVSKPWFASSASVGFSISTNSPNFMPFSLSISSSYIPILSATSLSTTSIKWEWGDLPDEQSYRVIASTGGNVSSSLAANTPNWIENGLLPAATYYRKVQALNSDGISSLSATVTGYTLTQAVTEAVELVGTGAKTIEILPPTGAVSVEVPVDAFAEEVMVTLQQPVSLPSSASSLGTALAATGVGVEISLSKSLQPKKLVAVTLGYRDSDVAGLDESRLILARYDAGSAVWIPLPSTPDPSDNRVMAKTNHFSAFQIMEAAPAASLSTVKVFPNPWSPAKGHSYMTFSSLPANATLKIYTLSGSLVRTIQASESGLASWSADNINGQPAGSGVYFVLIESAAGKKTIRVGIER